MNYILYGSQYPRIARHLKKILKERLKEPDDFNVTKWDASEDDVDEIISDMSLLPLGYDRKAILIDNADFLSNNGDKKILEKFTNEIKNDDSIDVIFILRDSSINEKCELVKRINLEGEVVSFKDISKEEWPIFIKKYFTDRGVSIDVDAINEVNNRVHGDLNLFFNEANKLILYKDHISLIDVTLLVSKPLEDDVFQISNALFRGDNASALEIYRDLKLLGNKLTDSLIPLLASQFRFISEVRFLVKRGLSNSDIASELGVNEFRVKYAIRNSKYLSPRQIAHVLDDLYYLDYQIKSGQIDRSYGFELFLINFPN